MRDISSTALSVIATKTGTEPITVVEVDYNDGTTVIYTDVLHPDSVGIGGKLLSINAIDDILKLDSGTKTSQVDIVLDDTDGAIKALMDQYDLHRRPVRVYQWFNGIDYSERFELFRGRIATPIVWSEGERTVNFTVLSDVYDYEVGFSPEEGQFPFISKKLIGKAWPLGFGSPVHVPCVKFDSKPVASVVSTFGFVDPVLPLKLELLTYRLERTVAAYNYYQQKMLELDRKTKKPHEYAVDYANHIVAYDALKQQIEDQRTAIERLNQQLDTLGDKYLDMFGEDDATPLRDEIDDLKESRDEKVRALKMLYDQQKIMEQEEVGFSIIAEQVKYKITTINKFRKKSRELIKSYYELLHQKRELNYAHERQLRLAGSSGGVMYGSDFEPDTREFQSKDTKFKGQVTGNSLSIETLLPSERAIELADREDENDDVKQYDTFWLKDYVPLQNQFIWLNVDGVKRIVKVTSQDDLRCTVDLPRKPKTKRGQKKRIDIEDTRVQQIFNETLDRLTKNSDDQAVREYYASLLPTTLSEDIWSILRGNDDTYIIKFRNKFDDDINEHNYGYTINDGIWCEFYLKIGEEIAGPFTSYMNEDEFKQKLLETTFSILDDDVTVTMPVLRPGVSDPDFCYIQVELKFEPGRVREVQLANVDIMPEYDNDRPLSYMTVEQKNINAGSIQEITFDIETYEDNLDKDFGQEYLFINVWCNGYSVPATIGENWNDILTRLISAADLNPGDLEVVSGGSLNDGPVQIRYQSNVSPVFIEYHPKFLELRYFGDLDVEPDRPDPAKMAIKVIDGSAFEYTRKVREGKLKNLIEDNVHGPAIRKIRQEFFDLLKEKRELEEDGELDESLDEDISPSAENYRRLARQIYQPESYAEEVYKPISDEEFRVLYEFELLDFVEKRNQVENLDAEVTEASDYQFDCTQFGDKIAEVSSVILPHWVAPLTQITNKEKRIAYIETLPKTTTGWFLFPGDEVTTAGEFEEKYIANLLPSAILAVYGRRNVNGVKRLVPIPSRYYRTYPSASGFGPYNPTIVEMKQPITTLDGDWDSEIYCTYTSTVGPNICDIIAWVVNNFTTLSVDSTTFSHVHTLQANYPANFALLEKKNALNLIEEIAWQARCRIWVDGNVVKIMYLSEEPTSIETFSESDIEQNSLQIFCTETEDVVTKLVGTWKPDYTVPDDYRVIMRRNVAKYLEVEREFSFYIYNIESLVRKSMTFWMSRLGTTWKKISFDTFLHKLKVEVNDCITIDRTRNDVSNGPVKVLVEQARYDPASSRISMECWTPIPFGSMEANAFAWPAGISTTVQYPTAEEIISGNGGSPLSVTVPSGNTFDPFDDDAERPLDFGDKKISDIDDEIPQNPANEFSTIDYEGNLAVTTEINDDEELALKEDILYANTEQNARFRSKERQEAAYGVEGRIIGVDKVTLDSSEIDGASSAVPIRDNIYEVLLPSGRTVKARCKGFSAELELPLETKCNVKYSTLTNEFEIFIQTLQSNPNP